MITPLELPASKLAPPRLRTNVVERARLLRALDEGTSTATLTLVMGYAGAGKSVLVSSWAASRPGVRLAWLTCDEVDTDPIRFWTALVSAVRRTEPTVGADTLDRIELDGRVGAGAIGVFAEELRGIEDSLIIVVDDLHKSSDPDLWPLLAAFVEWLPSPHRMVVTSRSEPSLPLHRWRVEGRLAEIRHEQLAFDDDEAAELLAGLGADVDRDAVSLLARRTEGWAAGLQLAGLSVRDRLDAVAYLHDIAETDSNIVDYLTDEVLDRQPDDIARFMLDTSVLRELDARACRALTGDRDAHARLRDIDARGLFLVPLDGGRQRYRYHQLFAELLQNRLRAKDEQHELELHGRAADWYAGEGDLDLAVFHAVRAHQTTRAVALMRDRLVHNYFSGVAEVRTRLIDVLDDDTLGRERELALEFALTIGMNGALDEAGRWLRRLARLEHLGDERAETTFQGRLAAAQSFWEMARGGAERASEHTERARQLLAPDEDIARELTIADGRVLHYLDDLDGVRALAARRPADGLPPMATVIMLGAQGGIEGDAGHLHVAERLGRAALELADELGARQHFAAGEALRVIASVQIERLQLDDADTLLEQALRIVERERPGIELLCLVDEVGLLIERGLLDDAAETVARLQSLVQRVRPSIPLVARVLDTSARLDLLVGEPDRAAATTSTAPAGPRRSLTEARIALARNRPHDARHALQTVVTNGWPRFELELALLRARTGVRLGRPDTEIDSHVERALTISDEHGFMRTTVLESHTLDEAFERALRRAPQGSHRDSISEALRTRVPLPRLTDATDGPLTPSNRELEILRHLATRLSNREIAAELFISLNTLKTHIRSLYRRLGVSSRSQAVAAGRARGLI